MANSVPGKRPPKAGPIYSSSKLASDKAGNKKVNVAAYGKANMTKKSGKMYGKKYG